MARNRPLERPAGPCVCCGDGEGERSGGMQEIRWSQMGEREVAAASEFFWRRPERNARNPVARGFQSLSRQVANLGSKIQTERMWGKLVVETFKERTCKI